MYGEYGAKGCTFCVIFPTEMYTRNLSEYSVTTEDTYQGANWHYTDFVTDVDLQSLQVMENTNNTTDEHLEVSHCSDWGEAQHAVFQLANLCMLISFLTPYTFRYHSFFLRVMVNFCYLLTVIWSAVIVCMSDVLVWNSVFVLINSVQMCYIGYKIAPDRFSKALEDAYSHVFKPLKVTRKQFKGIADLGAMQLLGKGSTYAKQDQNKTGQKLSILLKGRYVNFIKIMFFCCFGDGEK